MDKDKKEKPQKAGFIFLSINIIILLFFGSCASKAATRDSPSVYLAENSRFYLLPAYEIEKPMDMAQSVSASYDGRSYFMNAWVLADTSGIEMSLLNEFGANMGTLSYRDKKVSFSSPVFPKNIQGEYIVADFQLCFYNPLPLGEALKKCGLELETQGNGSRQILQGKNLIIEIHKTRNSVAYFNHLRGYNYTLEGDYEN